MNMTAKALQRKERENKPKSPREQPLQWNVIKATTTEKPSRPTRTAKRRNLDLDARYPGSRYQPGDWLVWFRVLSRAKESWLEALGDEERLKLAQRSVTFAGAFFSWSKKKKGRGFRRESLMAGQRRTSACLSFRFGSRLSSCASRW